MLFRQFATAALAALTLTQAAAFAGDRNTAVYNLEGGLGLKGYDPVAIFPEGGSAPAAGSPQISIDYQGVTYRFVSVRNREVFLQNPNRYEPTYGGWCAYAMASGGKVEIQPDQYTIHGDRAHYFVAARAKARFDQNVADFEAKADGHWKEISGEDPRK